VTTAAPSAQFLAMLPATLFTATPPEQLPPLLALLGAVEQQWLTLAADVDTVLDDVFADSAADWALPYLGSLLGLPPDASRAEVGYATALRRRKGTPAAVEDFSTVVTGWTARVLEGWRSTVWCQQLRHPVRRTASINLRAGEGLLVGSGLDPARHSVTPGAGYHPAAVTSTVFPWDVVRLDAVEVCPLPQPGRFAVHPLGVDAPLYLRPEPLLIASDAEDERPPGVPPATRPPRAPGDLPLRATWRLIEALATDPGQIAYGPAWSLGGGHPLTLGAADDPALITVTVDEVPVPWPAIGLTGLPPGGGPAPAADQLLIDPSRGVLAPGANITGTLRATFHRPVTGRLGAAASAEQFRDDAGFVVIVDPDGGAHPPGIPVVADVDAAVALAMALPGAEPVHAGDTAPDVEIRLATSGRLAAPTTLTGSPPRLRWRIVAAAGATPVLVGPVAVDLTGAQVEVAGCYLDSDLQIGADVAEVTLTNVTMNPPGGTALTVAADAWTLRLSATRCLLAAIRADIGAYPITLVDCVVDGHGDPLLPCGDEGSGLHGAGDPDRPALAAVNRFPPALVAAGVTFVNAVDVDNISATDCLFAGGLRTVVTSTGCLRFSHLGDNDDPMAHPPGYRCLTGPLPRFLATGFEAGGYYAPRIASPSAVPPAALLTGASDGGEIGGYHHARRGPLALRLAQRLGEMVPLATRPHLVIAPMEE
jgi:hypothetical protein